MDTMLLCPEKNFSNLLGISVFILSVAAVLILQNVFVPIFADEFVANIPTNLFYSEQNSVNILSEITMKSAIKKFDEDVSKRYPGAVIKDVVCGIKHISLVKFYDGKPVKINVIEFNPRLAKDFSVLPVLASDKLPAKKSISLMAQENNSLIALNGTFFKPQTGVPLGTLMINEKLYTGPVYNRVALGIFENDFDMARVQLNATISNKKNVVKIDNINQPRMLSTYVLIYTQDWGTVSPPSPKYGVQLAINADHVVSEISPISVNIPKDGYVIVGPESILNVFKLGEKVNIDISTIPEWKKVKHIISGGPYLVKNGEIYVDMSAQKLSSIGGKNPRSAIGYTLENNLILVAVDGREGSSVGMTLMQLAQFMKSVGCVNAMNLDGGGSTVMYVNGNVVNNPQVKGGINLSNAIVIGQKS